MHDPQQLEQWPPTSTCYQTSILLQLVMMLSSPEGQCLAMNSHSLPLSLSLYWSCLCTSNKAVCWGGESSYHRHTNQLKKPLASRFMGLSMLFLKAKVYYHCELFTWFSDKLIFKQICWGVMLHDEPPLRNQNLKVAPFLHTEFLHNYWHTHTLLINQFL